MAGLKETFDSKEPIIKKNNNYMDLTIIPTFSVLGKTNLIIPKKEKNEKDVINNLCNVINEQGKDISNLEGKIKALEDKIKILEKKMKEIETSMRKIKNKESLIGGIIKNEDQYNLISDWIDRNKELKFKLLYKGTIDGDTFDMFHNKCDNQGATISFIESTDNQIFGGYASKSWNKNNQGDVPDPNSFLFNLNLKKKYPVSNNKGLMKDYICDFGGSGFHELWIFTDFSSRGGGCDNGKGYNFKNYELSGGKRDFKIKELEVYKVESII